MKDGSMALKHQAEAIYTTQENRQSDREVRTQGVRWPVRYRTCQ